MQLKSTLIGKGTRKFPVISGLLGERITKQLRALSWLAGLLVCVPSHAAENLACHTVRDDVKRELDWYYENSAMESVRDKLLEEFLACIEKHPVCMGGYQNRQGKYSAAVWRAGVINAPITPKFIAAFSPEAKRYKVDQFPNIPGTSDTSDRDELDFALLQVPKALDGYPACIYAFNTQAHAIPWGMQVWRIKGGLGEKVKMQDEFAPPFNGRKGGMFSMVMEPIGLRTLMLDIYDYQVTKPKRK
jgi:hypothetical protein